MNKKVIWAGIIVFVAGMVVGFMPVRSHGVACGSAFKGSRDAYVSDLSRAIERDSQGLGLPDDSSDLSAASDGCDSLRSVVRIPSVVLLVVGGGIAVITYAASARRDVDEQGG